MPIKLTEFDQYAKKLKAFFPPEDIQWKVGATNKDKSKGIALAYLDSSAVMDRLDNVIGAENWTKCHEWGEKGEIMCGISILFEYPNGELKWHTKWDAGVQPEFEPEKGGISDSLKRSANCWGIGRYLRKFPTMWLPIEKRGRSHYFKQKPNIPNEFLPKGYKGNTNSKPNPQNPQNPLNDNQSNNQQEQKKDVNVERKTELMSLIGKNRDLVAVTNGFLENQGVDNVSSLTEEQYQSLKKILLKANGEEMKATN